jgi:hypothetical protein
MPNYFLPGGTVIWPLLLSDVAARAVISLASTYRPAVGAYPAGHLEADLEAIMCMIVNLVNAKRWSGPGLPTSTRPEREAEGLNNPPLLFPASPKRSCTMDDQRKTVWG